jgi:hypothetical protein
MRILLKVVYILAILAQHIERCFRCIRGFFLLNNTIFNTILQDNIVSKQLREITYLSVGEMSCSWNLSLLETSFT